MRGSARSSPASTFGAKWRTYQRERFPALAHGTLIAAFSFCAVSYSSLLRASPRAPAWRSLLVAFASSFLSFLMLRVADEFKDFEEDARYRSYRPVPRGLVTLRELGWLGVLSAGLQLALGVWLAPRLALLLAATWAYLALMSVEFFARRWLKARPFTYMWTHMMIMPLVDLYATGCDWLPARASLPAGLGWFLAVSFFSGVVIEVGRKIRAPGDEEPGVETYTAVWGRAKAVGTWLAAMALGALSACLAGSRIHFVAPLVVVLAAGLALAAAAAAAFLREPVSKNAKRIETAAGLWIIVLYLALGALPRVWRPWTP